MHKQPIKEVEVRKVVFQDVTPSISVQKNNLTPMSNNPTNVHPYEDAQNEDACVQLENNLTLFQQPVRQSTRVSRPLAKLTNYVMLTDASEPSCYKEAMLASDHVKWEHAMQSELDSIYKNGTWDLLHLPKDRKA